MSYHVQQNSQQKSLGIFVVVAFHVLLLSGLIFGLKARIIPDISGPITIDNLKEKPVEVDPLTPPDVKINNEPVFRIPTFNDPAIENDPIQPPITHTEPTIGTGGTTQSSISKPKLQNATTPAYPAASVRLEEHGTTGLNLYITADGRVTEATVISSSGYARLDEAALKHAQRYWKFSPCVENGTAVGCWFQTRLVWRLEDAKR